MPVPLLPRVTDETEYERLYPVAEVWLPAARAICARHGLPGDGLVRERTGTAVVFGVDGCIVKLYCPIWPEEFERESRGLSHWGNGKGKGTEEGAGGSPPGLPVPRLVARGELDGWPYVVMTRLPGVMVRDVWKDLAFADRAAILRRAGEIMAALHATPAGTDGPHDRPWADFTAERVEAFADDQRKRGLDEAWIARLRDRLVAGAPDRLEDRRVLLHCDLHWDHFLVERGHDGTWRVTGLLDFADAMAGSALYEFGAPLVYLAWGAPALRRELLRGYGYAEADLTADLSERLFTALLLHRFLNVRRCLDTICGGAVTTVDGLRDFFCGV